MLGKYFAALAALITLSLYGCGRGGDEWNKKRPPVYPISGIVLLDGLPVEGANVNLIPTANHPAAYGITDSDGKFELSTFGTNDGVAAGTYKITISKRVVESKPDPVDPELNPPQITKITHVVPKWYSTPEGSGLTVEVKESGNATLELSLTKKN